MKIYHGLSKVKGFKRPVVAFGVFDGVHLGHSLILKAAVRKARAIGGTSIAVTFFPHPQKKQSLYSLAHRLRLIGELGVVVCIVIKFTPAFANMRAGDFIKNIIAGTIGSRYVYIGKNFRFGRRAEADYKLLQGLAPQFNYQLKVFSPVKINNRLISSTQIRKFIIQGKLRQAEKFLSRPVSVLGSVVKGVSLARKIGFPTANINPHHEILPASGVYAVKIKLNGKKFSGICNIGRKPTVIQHSEDKHVEVHIFNFRSNIYGKDLEIQFLKKIRNEKKFSSFSALAVQIKKDVIKAKNSLS